MRKITKTILGYKPLLIGLFALLSLFTILQLTTGHAHALATKSATYSADHKTITVEGVAYTAGDSSILAYNTFYANPPSNAKCFAAANPGQGYNIIQVDKTDTTKATLGIHDVNNKCTVVSYTLAFTADAAAPAAAADAQAGTDTDPELDCSGWDPSAFGWFMCPIVHILTGAVTTLDGYMNSLLTINTEPIFDRSVNCVKTDPNYTDCTTSKQSAQAYYTAWSNIRNIALALMVLAGLIMVVAQAFGLEILDAYTVRKVMPRLLIVAIGISLSWPFMEFLINLTNDVGGSIREIIYAPFKGINGGTFGLRGGGNTLAGAFVLPGVLALKFGGVFSLVGSALLALGIGFLVMILRQIAITMLVILAPLALACYILPNTQKAYKFWWDAFSKALLMFPIISAFIAAGRVFAVTASSLAKGAPGGLGSVYEVSSVIAYIAPYFLLPLTVRFAGGLVGTLGGFANDRSRGLSDRLKNYRKNKIAKNGQDLKNGNYFKGTNPVSKGLSNFAEGVAAIPGAGLGPNPRNYRSRLKTSRDTNRAAYKSELQKSAAYSMIANSQDHAEAAYTMATQGEAAARQELAARRVKNAAGDMVPKYDASNINNIIGTARQVQRMAGSKHAFEVAALEARFNIPTRDTDAFQQVAVMSADGKTQAIDSEGKPIFENVYIGNGKLQLDMAKTAGNDASEAGRLQSTMRSSSVRAGRVDDGGHSFGAGMGAYFALNKALRDSGDGNVSNNVILEVAQNLTSSVLESQNAYTITNQGRKDSLEHLIPAMRTGAIQALESTDDKVVARKAAEMASYYENLNATSKEKADVYANNMMAYKFKMADGSYRTGREIVEAYRQTDEFREARREYGTSQGAGGATGSTTSTPTAP
jgi:hypothetical protein